MSKYGEPWKVSECGEFICNNENQCIVEEACHDRRISGDPHDEREIAMFKRIIACVNACIGLSDETLASVNRGDCVLDVR